MPAALFAAIVIVFVVVAVVVIRRTQRGAFVARLPLGEGEQVLLEEEGLKLFHRFRRTAVRGGGTVTHRVRSVLTDRRILLATGGPEGKHKFVILMILDYTTAAPSGPETGYAAYKRKFGLANGYPTYACSAPTSASRRMTARRACASSSPSPRQARAGAILPRYGSRHHKPRVTRKRFAARPAESGEPLVASARWATMRESGVSLPRICRLLRDAYGVASRDLLDGVAAPACAGLMFASADRENNARLVTCAEDDVLRLRRAVHEIPLPQGPLVALDQQ